MNNNLLKEIITKVGGNVENLPDNLLTTHLKALCEALGVDTSNVENNLITTLLKAMHGSDVPDNLLTTHLKALCETLGIDTSVLEDNLANSYLELILNGEVSGGGSLEDQLYKFYGVDKGVYPYVVVRYTTYGQANVYFSSDLKGAISSNMRFGFGSGIQYTYSGRIDSYSDVNSFLERIMHVIPCDVNFSPFISQYFQDRTEDTLAINFETDMTKTTIYSLE